MLVFSRGRDQKIMIGHNGEIEITVVEIRGQHVRIGIKAARETPVHRGEVFQRIQDQKGQSDGGK